MENREVGINIDKRQLVPVSELDKATVDLVLEKDREAENYFKLRGEVAYFYRKYRQFLPSEIVDDGNGKEYRRRFSITEVREKIDQGESLEEMIDWSGYQSQGKKRDELKKMEVVAAFKNVCDVDRELEDLDQRGIGEYYEDKYADLITVKMDIDSTNRRLKEIEDLKVEIVGEVVGNELNQKGAIYLNEQLDKERQVLEARMTEQIKTSREAYVYFYGNRLMEMKSILDKGGLVETDYVKSKIKKILSSLEVGKPVFIVGELGSGKTELAKHISRNYLGSEPLIISGFKDIGLEQIVGGRTVKKMENISPEEQTMFIEKKWKEFSQNLENGENKEGMREVYVAAYQEFFKNPVVVEATLGPLMRAMKEGRPLIIDEMNAIPHHILIMMNDLLLRKPGRVVEPMIPGAESFEIKKGFGVLATGNYKPEDGVMYIGRQPIDAAFLSRFQIVGYDYLPNNTSLEPEGLTVEEKRDWRAQNELVQMLAVRLLNEDLTATVPDDVFDQLSRLSMVARVLQDVFSGKEVSESWYARDGSNKVPPKDILKENVLSIRHLIPLIDKWRASGFTQSLDKILYNGYVTNSDARPAEKMYLYQILKIQGGFFDEADNWPGLENIREILNFDPETGKNGMAVITRKPNIVDLNQTQVIEALFGDRPELEEIDKKYLPREENEEGMENNGKNELETVGKKEVAERFKMILDLSDQEIKPKSVEDLLKVLGLKNTTELKNMIGETDLSDEDLEDIFTKLVEVNERE